MTALPKFRAWGGEEGSRRLARDAVRRRLPSGPHPSRFREVSRYTKRAHTPRVLRIGSTFCATLDVDRSATWLTGGIQLCVQAVPHQAPFKTSNAGQFGPGCVCACPYQGASRGCWPTDGAKRFTSGRLSRAARLRRPQRAVPRGAPTSVRRGASQPPRRLATHLTGGASARRRVSEFFATALNPCQDAPRGDTYAFKGLLGVGLLHAQQHGESFGSLSEIIGSETETSDARCG